MRSSEVLEPPVRIVPNGLRLRTGGSTLGVACLASLLLLWELFSRLDVLPVFQFPPPSMLASGLWEVAVRGFPEGVQIHSHVAVTLKRIFIGFLGAAAVGVPLGIVVGCVPPLDKLLRPIVTFGRSIAAISLLPLFIAWFGIGELSKMMLIGLAAFWVVLTYTIAGVKYVDPLLIRAARSMDAPAGVLFFQVILPAAAPRIFTGLRVAMGVAFMVIVAAEMIATVEGLGALIKEARNSFRTDITMVGMVVIGLLGWGMSALLGLLERWLLPYRVAMEQT